ncbi:hypothetical protein [uncultured Roseibium sp.]|uniref:hypothetical protein n=1 Tax=uncultured Roseibium sp. TaxID=1936171 RepID=UPI0032170BF0
MVISTFCGAGTRSWFTAPDSVANNQIPKKTTQMPIADKTIWTRDTGWRMAKKVRREDFSETGSGMMPSVFDQREKGKARPACTVLRTAPFLSLP